MADGYMDKTDPAAFSIHRYVESYHAAEQANKSKKIQHLIDEIADSLCTAENHQRYVYEHAPDFSGTADLQRVSSEAMLNIRRIRDWRDKLNAISADIAASGIDLSSSTNEKTAKRRDGQKTPNPFRVVDPAGTVPGIETQSRTSDKPSSLPDKSLRYGKSDSSAALQAEMTDSAENTGVKENAGHSGMNQATQEQVSEKSAFSPSEKELLRTIAQQAYEFSHMQPMEPNA